ncbi:hypothetical protein K8I85_09785 [bacterium]|nr:hypothetical protein [bacterium]
MRRLLPLVLAATVAFPATAAELCVTDGEWWCCHFLCDVPTPVDPSGYSTTTGLPSCGPGSSPVRISRSSTAPDLNNGPLTEPFLYLWVEGSATYGFSSASITLGGDIQVVDLAPEAGQVFWTPLKGHLEVFGCFFEPTLVATLTVDAPTDIDEATWGRIKALWK